MDAASHRERGLERPRPKNAYVCMSALNILYAHNFIV
jgi:hypothetical protein